MPQLRTFKGRMARTFVPALPLHGTHIPFFSPSCLGWDMGEEGSHPLTTRTALCHAAWPPVPLFNCSLQFAVPDSVQRVHAGLPRQRLNATARTTRAWLGQTTAGAIFTSH